MLTRRAATLTFGLASCLGSWIDPATPLQSVSSSLNAAETFHLVFSDEFNEDGRTFSDGQDPKWKAVHQPMGDLQFYNSSPEWVSTSQGSLRMKSERKEAEWLAWSNEDAALVKNTRDFTSSMLEGWNRFCFTGGIIEARVRFSGGRVRTSVALMGNLGRRGKQDSLDGVHPWSYDECPPGDDKKASKQAESQRFSACSFLPALGMNRRQGRGAPSVTLIRTGAPGLTDGPMPTSASASSGAFGHDLGFGLHVAAVAPTSGGPVNESTPLELAPSSGESRSDQLLCDVDKRGWCQGEYRPFCLGAYRASYLAASSPASSPASSQLGGEGGFRTVRVEWDQGSSLHWFIDGEFVMGIRDGPLRRQLGGARVPLEPSYLLFALEGSQGRSTLEVDWVRVFQKEGSSSFVGCDPKAFPTAKYIASRADIYGDWAPLTRHYASSKTTIQLFSVLLPGLCLLLLMALFVLGPRGLIRTAGQCLKFPCRACMWVFAMGSGHERPPGHSVSDETSPLIRP
eukprot:CAMPEP_0172653532 /NCGR_PEP_ID=MMETSP1068-20121228/243875_1 /TAXON_ID=35684 /ORGANISM="Pseudopedinella elastica, Strain CCMP716" /LENGTH=512 /DNA_ID=CAMNT_0013467967 /DNA_START=98 /DNA_END=1636 /DNA_ORIENTATION=-